MAITQYKPGESINTLTQRLGIDKEELRKLNPNLNRISLGENINIPDAFPSIGGTPPQGTTPSGQKLDPYTNQPIPDFSTIAKTINTPANAFKTNQYNLQAPTLASTLPQDEQARLDSQRDATYKALEEASKQNIAKIEQRGKTNIGAGKGFLAKIGALGRTVSGAPEDTGLGELSNIREKINQAIAEEQANLASKKAVVGTEYEGKVQDRIDKLNALQQQNFENAFKLAQQGRLEYQDQIALDKDIAKMSLDLPKGQSMTIGGVEFEGLQEPEPFWTAPDIKALMLKIPAGTNQILTDPYTGDQINVVGLNQDKDYNYYKSDNTKTGETSFVTLDRDGNIVNIVKTKGLIKTTGGDGGGGTTQPTSEERGLVEADIGAIKGMDGYLDTAKYAQIRDRVAVDSPKLLSWFDSAYKPQDVLNPNDPTAKKYFQTGYQQITPPKAEKLDDTSQRITDFKKGGYSKEFTKKKFAEAGFDDKETQAIIDKIYSQ